MSPVRVAERFSTASGRFSDGGWGAPGVPQPDIHAQKITAIAAQPFRRNELIAISLMEQPHSNAALSS